MIFAFEGFELDEEVFSVRRGDAEVPLRPQALEVLVFLVKNRGRLVTKRELLDAIWKGAVVSENTLLQAIAAIRRALGDDDEAPRIVETVRARGYRFIARVEEQRLERAPSMMAPPAALFVGREDGLRRLDEMLDATASSRIGLALISGGAGDGKTSLLDELARRARARGFDAQRSRCRTGEAGAPALWPWVELLRGYDPATPLGREAAALALELENGGGAGGGQFRAFDRVVQLLGSAARTTPTLLLVDDAHDADLPTLLLLKLVATSLRGARIAIAVTYRDGRLAPGSPFARTLGALAREEGARSVPLEPFSRDDVARLARARANVPESELDSIVDRLIEKSAGNPLLVAQMLHASIPAPVSASGGTIGGTSALLALREVREAIALQLEELSPRAVEVLVAAAVLGPDLSLGHLATMLRTSAAELLEPVDEATRARVLARTKDGGLGFVHALVRDVLYRRLAVGERIAMHRAAGATLLERAAVDAAIHHFERALRGLDRLHEAPEDSGDNAARARALSALLA